MKVDFTFFDYGGYDSFQAPSQKPFRITQEDETPKAVTVDYSKLIPVQIDAKTIVYVKPTRDRNDVLNKYLNREGNFLKGKGSRDDQDEPADN